MRELRFSQCVLAPDRRQLLRDGVEVAVEPQTFDVLLFLIDNRHRMVSKEDILDEVWGDRFVSESALTTRIKQARAAVGDDGRAQAVIKTFHGRGYRFIVDVEETTVGRPEIAVEEGPPSSEASSGDGLAEPHADGPTIEMPAIDLSVDQEFPFVGRGHEFDEAETLAEQARSHTSALLIGGEPGIGKTRFATELAARLQAEHGFMAFGGRCDRHLATSLQPWLEALGSYVHSQPVEQLTADCAGVADHLRLVMPSLDARLGPSESPASAALDEYAAMDAIAVLLERISLRQPLVVVLDDVQWAGGGTRALASLLVRRRLARVLMILTFRTTIGDLDQSARDWLAALHSTQNVERRDLVALNAQDVESLVAGVLKDEPEAANAVDQVWTMSGGHSLFAVELLRDLRTGTSTGDLPRSVSSLVQSRLAKLPSDVNDMVSGGAALGPTFDFTVAAAAVGLDEVAALRAVDAALDAELLHEVDDSPDRLRFSHQLVPAAILGAMSVSRRVRLHGRIVDVLRNGNGSLIEIAHHLLSASPILDRGEVIAEVRQTASLAVVDLQFDRAAELLERCSELDMDDRTQAEVLCELGTAYNLAALQPRALKPFQQASELAREHNWSDLLASAALGRWGQSPFRASQDRTVIPLLDEALGHSSELEEVTQARLLAKRAAFNLFTGDMVERDESSARALAMVGASPGWGRLEVLEARWMAIASPLMVETVAEIDAELAVLRKELGALTNDACAPEISMYWLGHGERLRVVAEDLEADPRARREIDQWRTTALGATFELFEHNYTQAHTMNDLALPLGREPWGESGEVVHALVDHLINVLNDEPDRSKQRWAEVAASVPSDSMRATNAWVDAITGDENRAANVIDELAPGLDLMVRNFMGGFGLVGFTEAALALDHEAVFGPLRQVLEPVSGFMLGHPWAPSLAAADLLHRVCQRLGDEASATKHQQTALDLYRQLGATSLLERFQRVSAQ